MFWNSLFLILVSIFGFIYFYIKRKYSYWENKNIKTIKPIFPFGNLKGVGTSIHIAEVTQKIYNEFVGKDLVAGIYLFTIPGLLILDPELIKQILVKDFNYFHNRGFYYNEKDDPLSAHLFSLEDEKWKNLRAKLTPTFTSGKMKMMFETVLQISYALDETLKLHLTKSNEIEIKDFMSRFSTDVIGSCAFGIDCNSLKDSNAEFRKYGRKVFEPPTTQILKIFFGNSFPNLGRKLKLKFFDPAVTKFFINVVRETVNFRKNNNIERKDFMQLLLDIEKKRVGNLDNLNIEDVAAQSFLFFLAGFETSSTTMNYCLYELARHQDIQNKLRDEIIENINEFGGITYDGLLKLPNLDKAINEAMRMYPAVENLIRITDSDYKIPGTTCVIEKDTPIFIPTYGIYHDPKIYPNPELFDPERFNEENVKERHPFTFLPFGEGPRVCIGTRFGLMQTRLGILTVLKNYRVSFCDKTPKVIEILPSAPVLSPKKPILLKLERL